MRNSDRSSRILLAGAGVSVAVHLGLATGFVRWSLAQARIIAPAEKQDAPAFQPETDRLPPTIRLGIEKSDAATMAWLGFEKATEHQAKQGDVEQSAMTLAAGSSAAEEAAPAPPAPPVPAPQPLAQPVSAEKVAAQVKDLSVKLAAAERSAARTLDALAEAIPTRPPPAAPAAEAPAQSAPSAATESDLPGIPTDKESVAVSVKKAPVVRPGQVLAAQGLEIKTRQPRWAYTTLLTRRPRNPTVSITFGRDGKVSRAEFVSDGTKVYNTGYDDVDQPLLNAIYAWTAQGKALQAKPAEKSAGVTVLVTIILAG